MLVELQEFMQAQGLVSHTDKVVTIGGMQNDP